MPKPKYFQAWIIFFLIATVGGAVLGGAIGFFIGIGMGIAHIDARVIKLVCAAVGFILSVPVSYFTFRWVVGEFIVKPVAPGPVPVPAAPPVLPPQS